MISLLLWPFGSKFLWLDIFALPLSRSLYPLWLSIDHHIQECHIFSELCFLLKKIVFLKKKQTFKGPNDSPPFLVLKGL